MENWEIMSMDEEKEMMEAEASAQELYKSI